MHELGAPSEASGSESDDAPEPGADAEQRAARRHRFHQVANYALSLAAMGALVAMLVGALLA